MESLAATKLIRLSKSSVGAAEKKAVMRVLDKEFLGMGVEVQDFENALSDFFGRPAVCMVNGTAALHLALQACGIGPGDEVLVQSLTYVASFQAISASGAVPVACDVDVKTLCLDWKDAKKRLTPRTKAIMPVHYSGGVGDLEEIYAFAEEYGLRVIEDAAHAFGSFYRGKKVGGFGDIACFSFDGIKNITSGEGGCIVTDDPLVLQRVKDARLLGVQHDTERRFLGQRSWEFDVKEQGWRYHMSNIMAAIGLVQLTRFSLFAQKRQSFAKRYRALLEKDGRVGTLEIDYDQVVPHIFTVVLRDGAARERIRSELLKYGIQTGIHYQPNHKHEMYRTAKAKFPVTDNISSRILTLPLHPDLNEGDIDYVVKTLIGVL